MNSDYLRRGTPDSATGGSRRQPPRITRRVAIATSDGQQLEGHVRVPPGVGLVDGLNERPARFIAVTGATLAGPGTAEPGATVAMNTAHIAWICEPSG